MTLRPDLGYAPPNVYASIVIPCLNEGQRLPRFLLELARRGVDHPERPVELIVVDDGSTAEHRAKHEEAVAEASSLLAAAGSPHVVRLVAMPMNQGKGAAIHTGWYESNPSSTWLGFLDADGAVPAHEVWRLVGLVGDDVDVLAGSRVRMAGRAIERSLFRHLQGRVFATFTEWGFGLGFYDTQCGVKLFRAALLRPHVKLLQERRWLLDVEILAVFDRLGGRMREEPIDWRDPGGSKVKFGVDALKMFVGLVRTRQRIDHYVASGAVRPMPEVIPSGAVDVEPANTVPFSTARRHAVSR